MTWWIRRNGHEEGPFSDDDMRKRITLNMIGSLDRVSTNRQRWQYLKDTELWHPKKKEVEVPPTFAVTAECGKDECGTSADASVHRTMEHSEQVHPSAVTSSVPIPERLRLPTESQPSRVNRTLIFAVCGGVAAVLAVALVAIVVMLFSRFPAKQGQVAATEGISASATNIAGFEAVREAVALIECKEGSGTGFLLNMDGKTYLISNEHVVRSAGKIEARLIDGTLLRLGKFSVAADRRDLARFEVVECNKKPLRLRETMPSLGEQVTVYGNSLGGGVATESKGFIQGVGPTKIETNAEIVHGNSGSPLLDVNNLVVGVAALIELTDTGREDWGNTNTRYDGKVRRYAVRLNGAIWKTIDRGEYEKQVHAFAEFKTFWDYLVPFLLIETGKVAEKNLIYNDLCAKDFTMSETGFNDILKDVATTYEKRGKAFARLNEREKDRKELMRRLNQEINSERLSKDSAEKALSEYDAKTQMTYEKMKEAFRKMILVRKEALSHARSFLTGRTWDAPQIQKGYGDDLSGSVDAYCNSIARGIDLMNQKMKDLNKDIKDIEKGDDDDEND